MVDSPLPALEFLSINPSSFIMFRAQHVLFCWFGMHGTFYHGSTRPREPKSTGQQWTEWSDILMMKSIVFDVYPLVNIQKKLLNMAINGGFTHYIQIVIFHSYVNVYQRVIQQCLIVKSLILHLLGDHILKFFNLQLFPRNAGNWIG